MKYEEFHVVLNPASSGGEAGRRWQETEKHVRRVLENVSCEQTAAPGDGERLAASAIHAGAKTIVVVGGDGTLSEVVNGLLQFSEGQRPKLAVLNHGTGGDFARTIGTPTDLQLMLEKIKAGREHRIDAGRMTFLNHQGIPTKRHFINIAGCGLAGSVVQSINQNVKRFGAFSYFSASFTNALTYNNAKVRISLDDGPQTQETITTVAVCNGQFFGGGMQIAPGASITDGLLNVTILGNWNLAQKIRYSRNLYNGTIEQCGGVRTARVKRIVIEPENLNDVLIDCDGEAPGKIPMAAEILPGAVRLII
ncbi:MAG: diacylglycerol kinase family lipid kinase [Spirochaetia bacterium]|nr:diacylglycerol kinase family lipid kinase [Spirochaetia bacterium]